MSVDHRMNTIIYYRIDYKVLLVLLVFMYTLDVIYMTVVIHMRMRITGRFKGYFLSVHMANSSATG